jgi:hypothetical protein
MPRVSLDCMPAVLSAKLAVVVHYLLHQLLDHLLANGAVLTLPPPIAVQRSHGFYSSDDLPWCRVRATHREDGRVAQNAIWDQILRRHRRSGR